jgi:hypothetical protein
MVLIEGQPSTNMVEYGQRSNSAPIKGDSASHRIITLSAGTTHLPRTRNKSGTILARMLKPATPCEQNVRVTEATMLKVNQPSDDEIKD